LVVFDIANFGTVVPLVLFQIGIANAARSIAHRGSCKGTFLSMKTMAGEMSGRQPPAVLGSSSKAHFLITKARGY
jgi:hypothetical protein